MVAAPYACTDAPHFVRSIFIEKDDWPFHLSGNTAKTSRLVSASSDKLPPITSAVDPDLGTVRTFMMDMLARGAFAALVAAILALLTRMRDLNSELIAELASKSRKRPPNETMRRSGS